MPDLRSWWICLACGTTWAIPDEYYCTPNCHPGAIVSVGPKSV